MFGFGKNKKESHQEQKKENYGEKKSVEKIIGRDHFTIHTMPDKFKKKFSSPGSSFVVNLAFFFIIFIIVGGSIFYFFGDYILPGNILSNSNKDNELLNQTNQTNTNENSNENENSNVNAFVNENDNKNTGLNRNYNLNTNNSNANFNTNFNKNVNTNINVNINPDIDPFPISIDRDNDSLTDIEESIYKTQINVSDTDSDGYLDGQEVANLYDPLFGPSNLIKDSDFISVYENSIYNYKLFYPKNWQAKSLNDNGRNVIFASQTGEFVEVKILDNPQNITAEDWYLEQIPAHLAYKVERLWVNNFRGVKSLDGLHFYLTPLSGKDNFIYNLSYVVGSRVQMSFPASFAMMARGFDVVK